MEDLVVSVTPAEETTVVAIVGEAGVANAGALDRGLMKASAGRPKLVVVDLGGVSFISSLAMGSLMAFQGGIVRNGGRVRFAALQPMVRDAFERARLHLICELCDSVNAATAAAAPSTSAPTSTPAV